MLLCYHAEKRIIVKAQHGVMAVHFNKKKLHDIIVDAIIKLQEEAKPS